MKRNKLLFESTNNIDNTASISDQILPPGAGCIKLLTVRFVVKW
jgi:hypothetical protein